MKLFGKLSIPSFRTKRIWGEPKNLNAEGPWHTGSVLAFPSLDGNVLLTSWKEEQHHSLLEMTQYLYPETWTSMVETTGKFCFADGNG